MRHARPGPQRSDHVKRPSYLQLGRPKVFGRPVRKPIGPVEPAPDPGRCPARHGGGVVNGRRHALVPGMLARYLVGEFLRILSLTLLAFIIVYLIADFSDRIDDFLKYQASVGAIVRYFLVRIPQMIPEVLPIAVLAAMLLTLGGLARHNEVTAMRASGISSAQIVAPLAGTCLVFSILVFVWSETVVPYFARRAHYINTVEIKKRQMQGMLGDQQIWSHGQDTFYNVQSFDPKKRMLVGVTIYPIDPEFHLKGLLEIPTASWDGNRWVYQTGRESRFGTDGQVEALALQPGTLDFQEKPEDLIGARRDAEEFSFFDLRDFVENFRKKGLDVTEYVVDLYLKTAVPFVCTVMALIAIPLGMRNPRSSSLANSIGADAYCRDAAVAVETAKSYMLKRQGSVGARMAKEAAS